MKSKLTFLLLMAFSVLQAQQSQLFRTVYYPAEPFGGPKELERFVKQEMVYPKDALEQGKGGEVFITFKVSSKGEIVFMQIAGEADEVLQEEAGRIFDRIVWEKDPSRNDPDIGFEKLLIKFNPKKYQKLVKKRGYDDLPMEEKAGEIPPTLYTINSVDEKPVFIADKDMNAFIKEHFKYPGIALQQNISGRVILQFVLEPYGIATNIRIKQAVGGGCNDETIRLVRMMRWEPAKKADKPVRCLYEYQLNFVNPGGTVR